MNMKRASLAILIILFASVARMFGQDAIRVEVPNVVAVGEQFNVNFIIEGEKKPTDFQWSAGQDFQLVWGPQKGTSTSVRIINGKRSTSSQTTFTYILVANSAGTFSLPAATAVLDGEDISSSQISIQVVNDGTSSPSGQSQGDRSQGGRSSEDAQEEMSRSGSSEIPSGDLFLRLSLSRSNVVIGEPITATLKLYQRVNIAGFENAKFPSFNGFWSQETYSPSNIEFTRESIDDKIYNSAVLRSYVLIPQQSGTLTIDPSELVCLVNVRAASRPSTSIFDSFFQDDYRTIRKRVVAPAVQVRVSALPSGQPASFGGGVGDFSVSAKLTSDKLKTHDAASLVVTVSGRGNISLLEEPDVSFPPDFDVYDTKTTLSTDKSNGGISGSKSFEFPFIPRSHGEFTIPPVEYAYYDVSSGKYVVAKTEPLTINVERGKATEASSASAPVQGIERKDVRSLADDIRFITTKLPSFTKEGSFFVGSPLFTLALVLLLLCAVAVHFSFRKLAAMRADVAGTKNRQATKMALKRLKLAGDYLDKNLYTAFYEELHKALLGFVSDKLGMDMSEINRDSIASALMAGGVGEERTGEFVSLLEACEFARYSSQAEQDGMASHYSQAVEVISSIDSSLRNSKPSRKVGKGLAMVAILLLSAGLPAICASASEAPEAQLWEEGVEAYSQGRFADAADSWSAILDAGLESPELHCNLGDAYFKLERYPKAILCYERALRLDPSFSEARYNLEFAAQFAQDKIEPVPEFILKSFARRVSHLLGSNAWAVLFLVLFAGFLALGLVFLLSPSRTARRLGFYAGLLLLVLSLGALGLSLWQKADCGRSDEAIVMSPVSSAKSAPSEGSAKDLFVVHEGTKVKVIDEVGDWKNISLADGRQGWILSADLEVI